MSLMLNSTEFTLAATDRAVLLSIQQFLCRFGYDMDQLYIDKFWTSIETNSWIVVDYAMLRWMGYTNGQSRNSRQAYLSILARYFSAGDEFEYVSSRDARVRAVADTSEKNVIVLRARIFKESLMLLNSPRSKQIRRYYIRLEDIWSDYRLYSQFVKDHNTQLEIAKLTAERDQYMQAVDPFDVDTSAMDHHEYVYVMTSRRYYRRCMFKIGKSVNPKSRLVSHNTTAATDDDKMFYTHVIPTFDCGSLEKQLHSAMARYHHSKEWYRIPHRYMLAIIRQVTASERALLAMINDQLSTNAFDDVENIPVESFVEADDITPDDTAMACVQPAIASAIDAMPDESPPDDIAVSCAQLSIASAPDAKHPLQCATCKKIFTSQARYNNHTRDGCKYAVPCPHCDRVFKGRTLMTNHVAKAHPNPE